MRKRNMLAFCFMLIAGISYAQQNDFKKLFSELTYAKSDAKKDSINNIITAQVEKELKDENFELFSELKNLSFLLSKDKRFAIVTWAVLYADFRFHYYGFVRYYEEDFDRYTVEKLMDKSDKIVNPERQVLDLNNWYGAFYYELVSVKYKRNRMYILLGWDGNNDLSTKKLIEVFYFDENQEAKFGKAVFESEAGIKNRIIFEYKEGISMNLYYDKKRDAIIWDHLSPAKPHLEGHFEYYGPDASFDALRFEKGIWKYIADIDLRK